MDYTDAIRELEKAAPTAKFEFPVKWGIDLQSEHEKFLTEQHFKGPVAVINYPKDIKAFYMRQNDDGKTVAAMDVLAPGIGEIIGGSQREERLERARHAHGRDEAQQGRLRLVPRPAPLRHRAARRLRPRLRARDPVRDRHRQHPRRDPVPARAAPGRLLMAGAADRDRLLTCHAVWFAPFPELRVDTDDALVSAPGARRVSTAEALACDLVLVLRADAPIASASIRAGTHLSLAPGVTVDAALRARAIWHDDAALAQVAAGIVDGRQLDEVTVFAAGAANNAGP
jgi:hypothetical protein